MASIKKFTRFLTHHSYLLVFIGLYPVLSLYSSNYGRVSFLLVIRSLVITAAFSAVLFFTSLLLIKDRKLSVVVSSLAAAVFLSYGHVYNALTGIEALSAIARHRFLAPAIVLLFGASVLYLLKKRAVLFQIIPILNIAGIYLLLSVGLSLALQAFDDYRSAVRSKAEVIEQYGLHSFANTLTPPAELPDIYLFVLDAYGSRQALQEGFGFDNQPFLSSLEEIGFFIPQCPQSNYALTTLSLSSMFQMAYADEFGADLIEENADWRDFGVFIRDNNVRLTLEDLGYKVVAFDTSLDWMNITDADHYFEKPERLTAVLFDFDSMNPFERLYANTTFYRALRAILPLQTFEENEDELIPARSAYVYQTIHYMLDQVTTIPKTVPGPKFVYVHVLATHYPYVVDAQGSFIHSQNSGDYIQAIKFINSKLLEITKGIIDDSKTPPIILLQADHGPTYQKPQYRLEPFAAYYLPDHGSQNFYDSITPVNIFRLVFNHYFGGEFQRIEDRSYFSRGDHPFDWIEIPNERPGCQSR